MCHWCRGHLSEQSATIDHVIPRSLGGTDALANLEMACIPCNTARGAPTGDIYSVVEAGDLW